MKERIILSKYADYGNWVPRKMLWAGGCAAAVLALLFVFGVIFRWKVIAALFGILFVLTLSLTLYMKKCSDLFDFKKGAVMGAVHQYLLDHLNWDGTGKALDIGCGAGALTIRMAKKYTEAELIGMDYWGAEWDYAKTQCENNAQIEGVSDRVCFQKGDAAKLAFPDETFDAAVSNFVFHEVRTAADKRDVILEALRVVKKGGYFAFQDMFAQKKLYGDMDAFAEKLKKEGISEIHYIGNVEKRENFIPAFATAPWMLSGVGLIYGRK